MAVHFFQASADCSKVATKNVALAPKVAIKSVEY